MLKNQVFGRSGGGEKYDTQITIMRVILVVLVVIGHGIFYTIDTNFGGIYIYEAMNDAGIKDTAFHTFYRIKDQRPQYHPSCQADAEGRDYEQL